MGFFGAVGKILSGKPVYTADDVAKQQTGEYMSTPPVPEMTQPAQPVQPARPAGPKQIPQVHFGRVESKLNGSKLDIYFDISNRSNDLLFLDNFSAMGQHYEFDTQLRPGETRQFWVYSGPQFTRQPSGYAELRYRKQADGDYFKGFFQIRSEKQADGTFHVIELRPSGPVKDI